MGIMNYRESITFPKITRLNYVNSFMNISTAHMDLGANFCTKKRIQRKNK